jgi:hypothetical protein
LLFDGQQHGDVHHLVKVPCYAVQFGQHVLAQGRGHFKMVSADRQVHQVLLVERLQSRRKRLVIGWGYFSAARGSWERR